MEFTGDEKKIQALFSELSLEQQSRTPSFEQLWRRAQANSPARPRFVSRFAMVMAAILAAACLIASSSRYRSSRFEPSANIPPQIIPSTTPDTRVIQPEQFLSAHSSDVHTAHPRRPVRQPRIERAAIREAAVLSNWQSPTNILLNSPAVSFLSSLPQLNQSARDLEQFLPKNNDVMKESKQ
jgi:hypothetical protein